MKKLAVVFNTGQYALIYDDDTACNTGELIATLHGPEMPHKTRHTIEQTRDGRRVNIMDGYFMYAQHSFTPTVHITRSGLVYALGVLTKGAPITFNYHTTESEITSPFTDNETGIFVS